MKFITRTSITPGKQGDLRVIMSLTKFVMQPTLHLH
jgi:hypothetical protein